MPSEGTSPRRRRWIYAAAALIFAGLSGLIMFSEAPKLETSSTPPDAEIIPERPRPGTPNARRSVFSISPPATEDESAVPPEHPFFRTRVRARVVDADTREGIGGALVRVRARLREPRLGPPGGDGSISFECGPHGYCELRGIPPGKFILEAEASEYMPASVPLEKGTRVEDDEGQVIEMVRARAVAGRVIDSAGAPVAGARVYSLEALRLGEPNLIARTDGEGRFHLEPVEPERAWLYAVDDRLGTAVVPVEAGVRRGVELVLERGPRLEGVVLGDGGPIEGAVVALAGLTGKGPKVALPPPFAPAAARTDRAGGFVLELPPRPPALLSVEAEGYAAAEQALSFGMTNTVRAELRLQRSTELSGRVIDDADRPVEGARVSVRKRSAFTAQGGLFRIDGLPSDGPYEVVIEHDSFPALTVREARAGSNHEYQLASPAAIQGRVVDARTDAPITRYKVLLRGPARFMGTVSSASGLLEYRGLPPGTYDLRVSAEGYDETTEERIVLGNGQVRELSIRLQPRAEEH